MLGQIKKDLEKLKNPEKAKTLRRFFKTRKGEYGEGDIFLGISVPDQRRVAKKYLDLPLPGIEKLLSDEIHEYRLTALLILASKFQKAGLDERGKIVGLYLRNIKKINNWDLIDLSAPKILGPWFFDKDRSFLYKLALSKNLWERRIGIMSTFAFIKVGQFQDTFKISEILLKDEHDLIHKAVGWMLREVGKKNQKTEEQFLRKHHCQMPRTMLRYAIEKFSEKKRKFYLKK